MKSKMSIRNLQLSFLAIAIAALVSCKKDNSASIATVTTNLSITNITGVSASGGGAVTDDKGETVTARGLCWSTNVNPTTKDSLTKDGSGAGAFTSTMANLQPNTTYYGRAYATNSAGTGYGNAVSFTTKKLPVLTTTAATSITPNSASSGGEVTDDGGQTITVRGVCWSTNPKPTIADSKITASGTTGVFTTNLVALTPNTTYYARAYATNAAGTGYGAAVSFTTIAPYAPVLTTIDATLISNTTATVGGNITDDGGQTVTERGICYSTSGTPTITDTKTADANGGSGIFNVNLSGLTANTTYYARAYATNASGTSYGNLVNFKTTELPIFPSQGLVAWYPFNGNANDESANGNNGTVNGATLTTDRFGKANSAFNFNGSGNYITIPNSNSLITTTISINVWVNTNINGSYKRILSKRNHSQGTSSYYSYGFAINPNGTVEIGYSIVECGDQTGSSVVGITSSAINSNSWIMLSMIIDAGGVCSFYKNGVKTESMQLGIYRGCSNSIADLRIGEWWSSDPQWFSGKVDDLGIWNRALTQDEVTALYNAK